MGFPKVPSEEELTIFIIFEKIASKGITPTHCKNYIGPESRTKDVFKQLDHAFQSMSEPWALLKNKELDIWPMSG